MAEISPSAVSPSRKDLATSDDENVESTVAAVRRGRRPKFTAKEGLVIAREVAASKAHIASFGNKRDLFTVAAGRANANPAMNTTVTSKSIQDRYLKLQTFYDRGETAQRKMSGVGGEVGELEELLGAMQEARADLEMKQTAERSAAREREEQKERLGKELVARSLRRDGRSNEESSSGSEVEEKRPRAKRSKRAAPQSDMMDDMKGFG
jgi:hypothetical protein